MYECTDDNGVLSEPPPKSPEGPQKITTDHLLKIDVPLVTQEYRESVRHYIVAQSEKVLDANGYMRMKTIVEHYLYTLNTSNDIGKPVLSDVVRFPQDVLTTFGKQNNSSKEDDSQESVSELINNCFKDLQIKSNFKLMKGKNQNNSKRERNKAEESGESCDEEVLSDEEIGGDYICICDDDQDAVSDSSCSTDSY